MTLKTTRCFVSLFALLALAALVVAASASSASAINISWVPVGNAGNAADPANGRGGVAYDYYISQFDVTVAQYTAFLNAVAKADTNGLYNSDLSQIAPALQWAGGISQTGSSPNFSYSVIGNTGNLPISYISWGDAARFANWIQNGQPTGAQGPLTTEQGAYTLNGAKTDAALMAITRNANATVFIPSQDEWYKAAYYNGAGSYFNYPYSSNSSPLSAPPSATPNSGNFQNALGEYALTGSTATLLNTTYLSNVGAYTGSGSPYNAYDMGGNVWQWIETATSATDRGYNGSSFSTSASLMQKAVQNFGAPTLESAGLGFRLATIPEPSTIAMASIGLVGLVGLALKRRRQRRA